MNNGLIAVHWNLDGEINSIIDVAQGRQLLPEGKRITVELAPDHPVVYDAWDLESWTRSLGAPITSTTSIELVTKHRLLAELVVRREFGASTLTQTYRMRAGMRPVRHRLRHRLARGRKLLSLMVPLDVHTSEATCDIQFGHVKRPTHVSSSWDAASSRCARTASSISASRCSGSRPERRSLWPRIQNGASLCRWLRAAKYPDPDADHGRHAVTISVLPHGPGLHDVLHEAEALNLPLRIVSGRSDHALESVVTIDHRGVQISSVKQRRRVGRCDRPPLRGLRRPNHR